MSDLKTLGGGCHCGKIRIEFATARSPADMTPFACDCSFCMKHGAAYVSDRAGTLSIEVSEPDAIGEYRQGSGTARCIVCHTCGVLVAVLVDDEAGTYGTVNSRCLDGGMAFGASKTVSPQHVSIEERRKLWLKTWIPGVRIKGTAA